MAGLGKIDPAVSGVEAAWLRGAGGGDRERRRRAGLVNCRDWVAGEMDCSGGEQRRPAVRMETESSS